MIERILSLLLPFQKPMGRVNTMRELLAKHKPTTPEEKEQDRLQWETT